jgi:ABC-2 type transport system ATP-binding protein
LGKSYLKQIHLKIHFHLYKTLKKINMSRTKKPEIVTELDNLYKQDLEIQKVVNPKQVSSISNKTVLNVQNLYKTYQNTNVTVLKNINFEIKTGDIIGVVGVNGSGKTTLFKCLLDIVNHKGIVSTNSEINKQKLFNILWVENGFDTDLTVEQNFIFYYNLYGLEYNKSELLSLLKEFRISKTINSVFKLLSSGQKRKCAICRTFIKSAPLILLDEPTGALDLVSQNHFGEFLDKRVKSDKSGCIMITHNYKDLQDICNKVLILNNGEILEFDTIENIAKTYLKGYLVKIWVMNNLENMKFIEKAISELNLQNHIIKNSETCVIMLRLKQEKDYSSFKKLHKNIGLLILNQKLEKIRFSTLIDLILSDIIFK